MNFIFCGYHPRKCCNPYEKTHFYGCLIEKDGDIHEISYLDMVDFIDSSYKPYININYCGLQAKNNRNPKK